MKVFLAGWLVDDGQLAEPRVGAVVEDLAVYVNCILVERWAVSTKPEPTSPRYRLPCVIASDPTTRSDGKTIDFLLTFTFGVQELTGIVSTTDRNFTRFKIGHCIVIDTDFYFVEPYPDYERNYQELGWPRYSWRIDSVQIEPGNDFLLDVTVVS